MKLFAALYSQLDASTATNAKVVALKTYFETAEPADAAWATYFLAGGKPRQAVPTKLLRQAALDASGLSPWLFEESYQAVGDLAETIATVLPPPTTLHELGLAQWLSQRLLPLRGAEPNEVVTSLCSYWAGLDIEQRFLMNKLITGGFHLAGSYALQ